MTRSKVSRAEHWRRRVVQLAERDGWWCWYCYVPLTLVPGEERPTIDERLPRCRGGLRTLENQVLACRPCNHSKGDMTTLEFLQVRAGKRVPASYRRWRKERQRLDRLPSLSQPIADAWPEPPDVAVSPGPTLPT